MNAEYQEYANKLKQTIKADFSISTYIKEIVDFLPASEYELILYMIEKKVWTGPIPLAPKGFKEGDGSIEFGLFLYWFNHPDQLNLDMFTFKEKLWIYGIILGIDYLLPKSKFDTINYDFFSPKESSDSKELTYNELIYTDGTVLSRKTYANFDQGWFTAFLNLFKTVIDILWYNDGKLPTPPASKLTLKGAKQDTVSIAVLGDWGAGNKASEAVMEQIKSLQPDYIIHVGDVYYGGTPKLTSPHGDKYFAPGEETQNLKDVWPTSYNGKSFTLNSNHEMYSGANGLFYDALGASNNPKGSGTPFSAQNGFSCFALEFGGWTLLGLDSAFMGHVKYAFMKGSIGAPDGPQATWIQELNLDPKKTILFTHHNGFADDCTSVLPLWDEINKALKGDPYAWYWGHVHNGIVYDSPISVPVEEGKPLMLLTDTYARCLGHAALPYGIASSLENKPIIYKADSLQPAPSKQLYNGFAMITLKTANNQLNSIEESFYDVSDQPQPRYSKTIL